METVWRGASISVGRTKRAIWLGLVATLFALNTALLLVLVGFGITRGEMNVTDTQSLHYGERLDRASNLAVAFFLIGELAVAWFAVKSGLLTRLRLHRATTLIGLFVASVLCSYCLVLLSMRGALPSPLLAFEHKLSAWLLACTR